MQFKLEVPEVESAIPALQQWRSEQGIAHPLIIEVRTYTAAIDMSWQFALSQKRVTKKFSTQIHLIKLLFFADLLPSSNKRMPTAIIQFRH